LLAPLVERELPQSFMNDRNGREPLSLSRLCHRPAATIEGCK